MCRYVRAASTRLVKRLGRVHPVDGFASCAPRSFSAVLWVIAVQAWRMWVAWSDERLPDVGGCASTRWGLGGDGQRGVSDYRFVYVSPARVAELSVGHLHYLQQTWRHVDGKEVGSHTETGFVVVVGDDAVEILNAQGGDRTEVLRGFVSVQDGVSVVDLHSVALAHDARMVGSWREIRLEENELRYSMAMTTTSVPEVALHLTARLTRQ